MDGADGPGATEVDRLVWLPIEFAPGTHRLLMRWCARTAAALDVHGLARADVIEALIEDMVHNEATAQAIRARLTARLSSTTEKLPTVTVTRT